MKFKNIIFDIDGTLGNSLPFCIESFQITLKETTGRDYTPEEISRYFGITEEGMLRHLVSPDLYDRTLTVYYRVFEDLQQKHNNTFPGIRPLLNRLHQAGANMGVVTGKGITTAEIALRHYNLLAYFDHFEGGSDQKHSKVNSIQKTLTALKANPEESLYIGDTKQDMLDTLTCGMWGAGAAWAPTATLHQADWKGRIRVFDSISDLETWLFH